MTSSYFHCTALASLRCHVALGVIVAACSASTPRTHMPRALGNVPYAASASIPAATPPRTPELPPRADALQRARSAVPTTTAAPDEAPWLASRALRAVGEATGALPAPSRVVLREGVAVWELLYDASIDASRVAGACARVCAAVPALACADDVVSWAGAERVRVVLAWRVVDAASSVGLAQPLRAMARVGEGLCLVHAERTLRTVDLTVRARDQESLARALAWMAVAPALSDLILVRAEPHAQGIEAVLSWPLARATGPAVLDNDPWPTRCDARSVVGAEAQSGTVPEPRVLLQGRTAGAVVGVGRREWFVTEGDRAASVDVVGVRGDGLHVRMRGRRAVAVLRWPPSPR